jgi:hypothetical protein
MKTVFLKQNENSGWSVFHVKLASQNGSSPQRLLKVEDDSCSSSSSILSGTSKLVLRPCHTIYSLQIVFTKWGRNGKYSLSVFELSYVYNDCWHTDQLFWVCLFLHHGDFWKGDNSTIRALFLSLWVVLKSGSMKTRRSSYILLTS